jgi:agmatinase
MKEHSKKYKLPHPAPLNALEHARPGGIATFMRLPHISDPEELDIALVGIPYDGGTTYRPGARFGPRQVRDQSVLIRPWNPVLQMSPFAKYRIADYGDFPVNPLSIEDTFRRVEEHMEPLMSASTRCTAVGGDHSLSLPLLRAVARKFGPVAVIQFDAHNDLWDEYFGCKLSHGTPFRRAIEEGLIRERSFLQVGLRGQVYGEDDFDFARAGSKCSKNSCMHFAANPCTSRWILTVWIPRTPRARGRRRWADSPARKCWSWCGRCAG